MKISIGLSAAFLIAIMAFAQAPAGAAKRAQEEANKKLAVEFMSPGTTTDRRLAIMHDDYVQHNPIFKRFGEINGTHGKGEFALLMKSVRFGPPKDEKADAPRPPAGDPAYIVMAEGDLVMILQKRYEPDPMKAGQFYETFWFDMWRVKDGKLYEHWDAATIPNEIPEFLKGPVKSN
jgi:predicted SnoaL-like aldol condensation-catalyzing enzyme